MPETNPIACTLDAAELPERAVAMSQLGEGLVAVHADGKEALFRFAANRDAVEEFARAESSCCAFFDFAINERENEIELGVSAPDEGTWAVRGLVAGFVAAWGGLV